MNRLKQFLLNFIQTQLLVTLVALPLLVGWGLGLSLMTFVGNLIFAPLLMIMIMLSSFLFFTQLCNLPNAWIGSLFSFFTHLWDLLLQLGKKEWIITFAHPGIIALVCIPIGAYFVLKHHSLNTQKKKIIVIASLLTCTCLALWAYEKIIVTYFKPSLKNKDFSVSIINAQYIQFIDHGFFASRASTEKAVEFEIKPMLIKQFGNRAIKKLILTKPGQRSFTGAQALCTHMMVKQVSLPFFNQKLSKKGWRTFFSLKRFLQEHKICLKRSYLK